MCGKHIVTVVLMIVSSYLVTCSIGHFYLLRLFNHVYINQNTNYINSCDGCICVFINLKFNK